MESNVGKYERWEAIPSIEVAKRIVDALEVYLDYLVGEGTNSEFYKKNFNVDLINRTIGRR